MNHLRVASVCVLLGDGQVRLHLYLLRCLPRDRGAARLVLLSSEHPVTLSVPFSFTPTVSWALMRLFSFLPVQLGSLLLVHNLLPRCIRWLFSKCVLRPHYAFFPRFTLFLIPIILAFGCTVSVVDFLLTGGTLLLPGHLRKPNPLGMAGLDRPGEPGPLLELLVDADRLVLDPLRSLGLQCLQPRDHLVLLPQDRLLLRNSDQVRSLRFDAPSQPFVLSGLSGAHLGDPVLIFLEVLFLLESFVGPQHLAPLFVSAL